MIECVDENIWYIKKKKSRKKTKKRKRLFVFALVVLIFGGIYLYYDLIVTKNLADQSEEIITELSVIAVNDAVISTLYLDDYENLLKIERNANGDINYLEIDTIKSNKINRTVSKIAKENLSKALFDGVPIPMGTFTGISFLTGMGKSVHVNIASVENIVCTFKSDFIGKGINQTLHKLYLNVNVYVDILIPNFKRQKITTSEILLSESLIVGKIPDVFLENNN